MIRLTEVGEFSSVFGYRCVVRSRHFAVFARPNTLVVGRLGMTIGRRVASRAVDRNYIKRIVREIFRRNVVSFSGLDTVVQLRQLFGRGIYMTVENELLDAVTQLRRKCPTS